MLSHVEEAAVTEEVSLIAVPAKMPKDSPEVVLKPIRLPNSGKKIAARTLKKKMTDMACATSSSSASITGAVAAMAEPPQMEEPTPTRVEILPGIRMNIDEDKDEIMDRNEEGRSVSFNPPRYEYYYNFNITIHVNSPWFDEISFRVNNSRVEGRGSVEYHDGYRLL